MKIMNWMFRCFGFDLSFWTPLYLSFVLFILFICTTTKTSDKFIGANNKKKKQQQKTATTTTPDIEKWPINKMMIFSLAHMETKPCLRAAVYTRHYSKDTHPQKPVVVRRDPNSAFIWLADVRLAYGTFSHSPIYRCVLSLICWRARAYTFSLCIAVRCGQQQKVQHDTILFPPFHFNDLLNFMCRSLAIACIWKM